MTGRGREAEIYGPEDGYSPDFDSNQPEALDSGQRYERSLVVSELSKVLELPEYETHALFYYFNCSYGLPDDYPEEQYMNDLEFALISIGEAYDKLLWKVPGYERSNLDDNEKKVLNIVLHGWEPSRSRVNPGLLQPDMELARFSSCLTSGLRKIMSVTAKEKNRQRP